ncbi:MAG: pyridoxamine 5'-phosphate oxidase family protein [Turicibacter sp.]|nr:pyridoxamine 5'-phosphate oxidase family protein [Turicibacter sp.]
MNTKTQAERLHQAADTFIITCVDSDGYPMTKAVVPGRHRDRLNELYFATNTSSKFANEITKNPKASVYFYDKIHFQGCFLKGKMEIVDDMATKEKYWLEDYKEAYPQQSFADPDFCLLKFTPQFGRFYTGEDALDFEIPKSAKRRLDNEK